MEYFPGLAPLEILQKIQSDLLDRNIEPEDFGDRIIFMSIFNDIGRTRKGNEEICLSNSPKVKMYAKRFSQGRWTFFCPGDEKKWYGGCNYKPEGKWNSIASRRVHRFKETGHPIFTSAGALSRGILRKLIGKETIHFIQCGYFEHKALIQNHSFCQSAQYLQSSFKMV